MSKNVDALFVDIDPYRATLKDARDIAAVILESFSKSPVSHIKWGPDYTFTERPIPTEQLSRYNALQEVNAWSIWLNLCNENFRCYTAVKGGKPVGFCMWSVPQQEQTNKLPWWHKIRTYLIRAWFNIIKVWYFGFNFNPLSLPAELKNTTAEFNKKNGLSHDEPEKRRVELSKLSADELAKQRYLLADYYWCNLLALESGQHGKGIGSWLFRESIKKLRTRDILLDGKVRPARLGLIASDMGKPVYERYGLRPFGLLSSDYQGRTYTANVMEMILNHD